MYDELHTDVPRWVTRIPVVAGVLVAVVAVLVLLGWVREFPLVLDIAPALPSMKANTAVCCLAAGPSLLGPPRRSPWRLLAVVPVLVGTATLVEWVGGVSLGIDELLVDDPFTSVHPGRTSPQVALSLVLFGLARLAGTSRRARLREYGHAAAAAFATIALLLALGFLFAAPELTSTGNDAGMALPAAVCIGLLLAGLLALNADRRPLTYLWHPGVTGTLTRRLLPTVVLVPPALGVLRLLGQKQGWYGLNFGAATFTGSMVVVLAVVVTVTARTVAAAEADAAVAHRALREAEQRARYLADHDPLTKLWNRRHFERELTEVLAAPRAAGGLLVVDIDHFKDVNDTLGHHAGDELLVAVGAGLTACVADRGSVSRIGGDEFAVLLHAGDRRDVDRVAADIVTTVRECAGVAGLPVRPSASVGVSPFADLDPTDWTRRALLTRTDEALYDAKRAGRGRHVVHGAAPQADVGVDLGLGG